MPIGGRMKRSRVALMVILVGGAAVGVGCGGGSSPVTVNKIVPKSTSQQQNVMVIDEGIDLSASDLQGRVAAAYTETCADDSSDAGLAGPGGAVDGGPAFDALKQMFLAALSHPDDSCHL